MTLTTELIVTLAGFGGNLLLGALVAGRLIERLSGLKEQLRDQALRFDGDLGRLNAKVENDVHGRAAVARMQQDVARIGATVEHLRDSLDQLGQRLAAHEVRRSEAA